MPETKLRVEKPLVVTRRLRAPRAQPRSQPIVCLTHGLLVRERSRIDRLKPGHPTPCKFYLASAEEQVAEVKHRLEVIIIQTQRPFVGLASHVRLSDRLMGPAKRVLKSRFARILFRSDPRPG